MSRLRFDGRVAIITGAGRGIGRAHALLLAARGARIVVADVGSDTTGSGSSSEPAEAVVEEIRAGAGEAVACCVSVAEESAGETVVETAIRAYGRIDILVNNAGISDPDRFEHLSVERFRRMIDVHFFGTLFMIRSCWPHFVDQGYGRVVNTTSESMGGGIGDLTSYASAKGAVFGLTRSLATEAFGTGVTVNGIAPRGFTRMSTSHSLASKPQKHIDKMKVAMAPELNSPTVAFLAHESCLLNGEILRSGMASVSRMTLVQSKGLARDELLPEDIADNIEQIMDVTAPTVMDSRPLSRDD